MVAGWPEKLISYNPEKPREPYDIVAGWPEKLISYNSFLAFLPYSKVAGWPEKLISYNSDFRIGSNGQLQVDQKN